VPRVNASPEGNLIRETADFKLGMPPRFQFKNEDGNHRMALLRYPGGKSKYTDFILPALYKLSGFSLYVEPFVGGGSVALAIAAKHPNIKLVLNDFDQGLAAFWDLIANAPDSEFQSFEDRILNTQPTVAMFEEMLETNASDRVDKAFRTFFLNRTSYGGMGWLPLGGWEQTSKGKIDSRWGSARKVLELRQARGLLCGRTKVLNADFARVIPLAHEKALMFLDPLYYEKGNELYNFTWSDADHVRLRDLLRLAKCNWVLSYDDHVRIRDLYRTLARPFPVKYTLGKKRKKMGELLLFPRLEFPTEINPEVGVEGIGDTLSLWIKGYGPHD
jgi:DNA adenine methylase